jgi:hypothetical protein
MLCRIEGMMYFCNNNNNNKKTNVLFGLVILRFCRCLNRSLEIVETSGHFIHCFDKASATHIPWTNENNSLFVSRSEEMFVNFVESWFKRSSTTVARSSDEASGPC